MYKQDLGLNNLQGLIYHKTQPTNQPFVYKFHLSLPPLSLSLSLSLRYIPIYVCARSLRICLCVCVSACVACVCDTLNVYQTAIDSKIALHLIWCQLCLIILLCAGQNDK